MKGAYPPAALPLPPPPCPTAAAAAAAAAGCCQNARCALPVTAVWGCWLCCEECRRLRPPAAASRGCCCCGGCQGRLQRRQSIHGQIAPRPHEPGGCTPLPRRPHAPTPTHWFARYVPQLCALIPLCVDRVAKVFHMAAQATASTPATHLMHEALGAAPGARAEAACAVSTERPCKQGGMSQISLGYQGQCQIHHGITQGCPSYSLMGFRVMGGCASIACFTGEATRCPLASSAICAAQATAGVDTPQLAMHAGGQRVRSSGLQRCGIMCR